MERTKQQESDELSAKVAAFLASGGKPYQAAPGESADKSQLGAVAIAKSKINSVTEDFSGRRFGKLVVIRRGNDRSRQGYWMCECDCGAHELVPKIKLERGEKTMCRACKPNKPKKKRAKQIKAEQHKAKKKTGSDGFNIAGQKFGRLTAIEIDRSVTNGKRKWICQCECGNKISALTTRLLNGHRKTCGCYHDKGKKSYAGKDSSSLGVAGRWIYT